MGSWRWCFGPPPFGLHYARWLYRDGDAAGRERLRLMQAESAQNRWEQLQTWHSALPLEDHSAAWISDRASAWLGDVQEPFFGWVSYCDPHQPMSPPAPWATAYAPDELLPEMPRFNPRELEGKPRAHSVWAKGFKGTPYAWANPGGANLKPEGLAIMTAAYYGAVSFIDEQIGRVLTALDERGLSDDTLVIFTSDHGALLGEHGMLFNGPVHYDELLRVPLIVRGKSFPTAGESDDPVGLVDLAPTVLDAAGMRVPKWMEGRSLTRKDAREHVVTEDDYQDAFQLSLRTLTTRRHKITRYIGREGVGELYDLQEDPHEMSNLWASQKHWSLRSELLASLDAAANRSSRAENRVGLIG
jgi:arylsulfatase A-like enzyme